MTDAPVFGSFALTRMSFKFLGFLKPNVILVSAIDFVTDDRFSRSQFFIMISRGAVKPGLYVMMKNRDSSLSVDLDLYSNRVTRLVLHTLMRDSFSDLSGYPLRIKWQSKIKECLIKSLCQLQMRRTLRN